MSLIILFTWLLNSWKACSVPCQSVVKTRPLRRTFSNAWTSHVCQETPLQYRIASATVVLTVHHKTQTSLSRSADRSTNAMTELPKQRQVQVDWSELSALFWKSHCATCSTACVILYHVIGSCKGPIKPFSSNLASARDWTIRSACMWALDWPISKDLEFQTSGDREEQTTFPMQIVILFINKEKFPL